MVARSDFSEDRELGRGRSAVVLLDRTDDGRSIARKVFVSDTASRIVLYVLEGSPNSYGWCEDAILAAAARRHILGTLVPYWFDKRLRLPALYGTSWNEAYRAWELQAEFITGAHLPLRGPFLDEDVDRLSELLNDIMRPLQSRLEEAGFDGLVWQAGLGNPVALGNFMLRDGTKQSGWVWVDLESGVPALFAISPWAQLRFYVPHCLRLGRALFDDVNISKLRDYLTAQRSMLEQKCGRDAYEELLQRTDELDYHQLRWKALPRHHRSIGSYLARGRITAEEAERFRGQPVRWYSRLLRHALTRTLRFAVTLPGRALRWLKKIDLGALMTAVGRFAVSQRYRSEIARRYVSQRIESWRIRKSIDDDEAARLQDELDRDDASVYITDFGVHLMIKPFVKLLQWWVLPAAAAAGLVPPLVLGVVLVAGGAIARTFYTFGRLIQATFQGRRRPWVALGVGILPVIGNTAYPLELVVSSVGDAHLLARFILYDTCAAVGRSIPIWGGKDTLTEHYANRFPDFFVRGLRTLPWPFRSEGIRA